jgi:hypothetical protein
MQKIILSVALLLVGFCIKAYAQVPTNGLIANYQFDNAANIGADSGPNAYALTNSNSPTAISQNGGLTDQNAVFNGVANLSSTNAAFRPTSVTVAGWVYRGSVLQYSAVAGVRQNAATSPYNSYFLSVGSTNSGKLNFTVSTANTADLTALSTTTLSLNRWYHVAGTYDESAATLKVYIDGVLEGTVVQAGAGAIAYTTQPFCIGGLTGVAQTNLTGQLDDVLVYNRALTATEVANIKNATKPSAPWEILNLPAVTDIAAISNSRLAYIQGNELKQFTGLTNTGILTFWGSGSFNWANGRTLESLSASSDGAIFLKTGGLSTNNIYRSTGVGIDPSLLSTIKTSVAARSANEAYATNINNGVTYQYTNTSGNFNGWAGSNGAGSYIAASENGRVWVIGFGSDSRTYNYNAGSNAWELTSAGNGFTSIALANDQTYATISNGAVYKYAGGNAWTLISTIPAMAKVTAAADGTLYGKEIGTNLVYRIPLCVTVSASAAINNCGGANLTATGTGTSYAWSNNATTATTTVATAGTYTVTTTNATGCTGSSRVVVTAAQIGTGLTPQTITGATTALTNTAQIYSVPTTANVAYQWSLPLGGGTIASGATTSSATINWGATAGTFRVKVLKTLSGSTCPSIADSMTVTLTAPPPPLRVAYSFNAGNANNDLGTNNNGVVTGATLTSDRFGNSNKAYTFNGATTQNINVGDVVALNNTAQYTISMWFKQSNNAVQVAGLWNKSKNNGGTYDDFIQSRTYGNGTFYGYNMVSPDLSYTSFSATQTYASNTWAHYVVVYDGTQAAASRHKTYINGTLVTTGIVGSFPATSPNLTGGNLVFGQANANYYGANGWNGAIDDIYIINRVLTQTQIDSLRNAPNPCTVAINITGSTSFCAGGETTLVASGGIAYVWNDGTNTPYNSITAAGTYTVSVANASGCAGSTSIVVTTNAAPTASITGNANFCIYSSATLTATGGISYVWSTNATSPSITTVAQNTFTVTVTNANGCTATATQATSFLLTPKATGGGPGITNLLTGNPSAVCAASLFTLGADFIQTASPTYLWSTGSTGNGIAVTLNTTTTYTVTITNGNGCTATGQRTITAIPLPTPTIASGGNVLSCGTFTTYQWFLNGAPIATTATFTATQSGNYEVRVTNADGCVGTSPVFNHTFVGTENSAFQSSVSILPNPVHDILFIKTSNTDLATLEISDIMGRKVEQINHNIPNSIDLSDLQNGVYLVRIADNAGNSFTQKIIKE